MPLVLSIAICFFFCLQAEGNITSSIIFCVRTAKEKKENCKNLKSEARVTCFWADSSIYLCKNCKGCL